MTLTKYEKRVQQLELEIEIKTQSQTKDDLFKQLESRIFTNFVDYLKAAQAIGLTLEDIIVKSYEDID